MSEQVLGVPRSVLDDTGSFQGFTLMHPRYESLFRAENQEFRPRDEVEEDPTFKQLIPYIIFKRGHLIMSYYRSKLNGETRLRGNRSIGIGGHINPEDDQEHKYPELLNRPDYLSDVYVNGMLREIDEELKFNVQPPEYYSRIAGLINDDSNDVGKVHLGVVHLVFLDRGTNMVPKEENIRDINWYRGDAYTKPEALAEFESWSQILLPHHLTWRQQPTRAKQLD